MKGHYKVAIVGGGVSGLAAAVGLIDNVITGEDIVILERNDRVGKKLLATGNGQGNITNRRLSEEFYHGDKHFISAFLENCKSIDLEKFFNSLGIFYEEGEDGKIYPMSKQANSILDALRAKIEYNRIQILVNTKVQNIIKNDGLFTLVFDEGKITAEYVVLAFGGKCGRQFGTDGSSYLLAENFGHKITNLYPSLVQLKTDTLKIKGLKGLKEFVKITVFDGEKPIKSEIGDILFTDYGVSGSAVFKISGYVAELKKPILKIEFLPKISKNIIARMLEHKCSLDFLDKRYMLSGLLNKIIGRRLFELADDKTPCGIAELLKNFTLNVTGNTGFDNAQVTKGGVDVLGVDMDTYESKIERGIYMVGEVLNIDGDCGGYNLSFAFVTGLTAGKYIAKKIKLRGKML